METTKNGTAVGTKLTLRGRDFTVTEQTESVYGTLYVLKGERVGVRRCGGITASDDAVAEHAGNGRNERRQSTRPQRVAMLMRALEILGESVSKADAGCTVAV